MATLFAPGSPPYRIAHDLGRNLHLLLARHPRAAERWFGLFSLLRHAPAGAYKGRIANSVASVKWPELKVPPQRVVLGSGTRVLLRPHPGEFDFQALLTREFGYEAAVFAWLEAQLGRYDTVVEIGANVGVFTVFMNELKRRAGRATPRILSFEPSRLAYSRLLDNLALNQLDAEVFNCAVGERAGIMDFYAPAGHLTNGSFDRAFAEIFSRDVQVQKVLAIGAAEIAALTGQAGKTLLKIDVENAEPEVMRGLRPWVTAVRPDVILEVLPAVSEELRRQDYLAALGYRFHRLEQHGPVQVTPYAPSSSHRDHLLLAG